MLTRAVNLGVVRTRSDLDDALGVPVAAVNGALLASTPCKKAGCSLLAADPSICGHDLLLSLLLLIISLGQADKPRILFHKLSHVRDWQFPNPSMARELGVTSIGLSVGLVSSPVGGAVAITGPATGLGVGSHIDVRQYFRTI